jgi:hypothetical protein
LRLFVSVSFGGAIFASTTSASAEIAGESQRGEFPDWIDVDSDSWENILNFDNE